MKNISIFAANRCPAGHIYLKLAYKVGFLLAKNGFTVISGGGEGLMDMVLKGAKAAGGRTIGVRLMIKERKHSQYADKVLMFRSLAARQEKMIALGDAYIALPGGIGTVHELCDILIRKKMKKINTTTPLIMVGDHYRPFQKMINEIDHNRLSRVKLHSLCNFVSRPTGMLKKIKYYQLHYKNNTISKSSSPRP